MKNPRTFRSLARSLLGAALTSASAFAISPDDLSALRAKAETGDGIAQHNLGLVYANSQESVADLVEAYAWLNLAADNGATGRSLVIVTRQMTPEQIADGKRRFEQIREAIAAKTTVPPIAASPVSSTQRTSPISPVAESPVSASPIRAAGRPVTAADADAQTAELRKISAELAAAWKENDQLKATLANAEKNAGAGALKTERDQLASSLESANREIATMKAAAANFEGERNGLLQKITAAQQASDGELKLKVVALENDLAKARSTTSELDAAKRSIATMTEQQKQLTAENERLAGLATQTGKASSTQVSEAQKNLAAVRSELAAAKTAQAEAAKKIAAGEKTAADLTAAQARIRTLESDAAKLSTEKQELTAKLAAAASPAEIKRAATEVAEAKDRAAASQQALTLANAEVKSLRQELQGAKSGVVPVQQHRELQARLEARAAEQQAAAQAELKKAQEAAEAEKARLTAELAAATATSTQEIGSLKAGAANFEGERNGLLKKISETEQALAAATADVAALKKQADSSKADTVPVGQLKDLEAKLEAATKAQEEQQKTVAELQKSLVAAESEKSSLTEKLTALADSATREAAGLKAGAANFEGERNGLLKKIAESEEALARSTAEAAAAKAQLASAQAASGNAERATAELARLTQELEATKQNGVSTAQAIADARAENADLARQLAQAKAETVPAQQLQELQAKLDAALKTQEQQQASGGDLQKTVVALEAERNSLREKLEALSDANTSESTALKAAASNFENERNGLLQKVADAEQALVRANAEATALKEQLATSAKPADAPAQEVRDLQAKLDAATRAQEAQQQQQAALQEANTRLEAEGARLARELAAAQTPAAEAPRSNAAAEELQAKLTAAEEAASTARAEREAMAQRVAVLEQQAAAPASAATTAAPGEDAGELRKQLDDTAGKLAASLRSFQLKEEEIDRLQKSLVSTDNERAALAERVARVEKQMAAARPAPAAGSQDASSQVAALREQLRNAQNQAGQLAAENSQLRSRATAGPATPILSTPRRPADTMSPTSSTVRAAQAPESRTHTVAEGETLTRIARRYYGNSERWADIYDANRASLPDPSALKIGMKLRIP